MTDHLPECPLLEPCDDEVAEHGYCSMQHGVFCIHCQQWCICDRLRACEQRVLARAREAISWVQDMDEALDVMDALRDWDEPPPLPPSQGVPTTPMWPLQREKS